MAKASIEINGKAMAVLVGAILLVAPWLSEISFWYKLAVAVVGLILILLGVKD